MHNEHMPSIGIDGGGTGSRYTFRLSGDETIKAEGLPLQGSVMQAEEVARRIFDVIKNTLGNKASNVALLRAGIAGFASQDRSRALEQHLKKNLNRARVEIYSDVSTTFAAAFGTKTSGNALLICGTGSVLATGETNSRKIRLIGGSGPDTIEPGSGRQIGKDFLPFFESFSFADKLDLLNQYGLSTEKNDARMLQIFSERPSLLAPVCLNMAEKGDGTAESITFDHINKTTELLHTAIANNALVKKLALHGGLFDNSYFREMMVHSLVKHHPEIHILDTPKNLTDLISRPEFSVPAVTQSD